MLSDESIHNTVLHRPSSKSNHQPFLVPLNRDNVLSSQHHPSRQNTAASKYTTLTDIKDLKSLGGTSHKSIRILRPETLKRAIDDACMAASIGDLEWLKQSLVITSDIHYDKNVKSLLWIFNTIILNFRKLKHLGLCNNSSCQHSRTIKHSQVSDRRDGLRPEFSVTARLETGSFVH